MAVLTGAGISAESGIPTFRGAGGLWRKYRSENLATPEAFARDPELIWEWYDWRRSVIATAEPNAGHRALAELERRATHFTLVTQNVDGLHDRAGSRRLLKVHGDIWSLRCTACKREWQDLRPSLPELPPLCACGKMGRPGVVWFGEALSGGRARRGSFSGRGHVGGGLSGGGAGAACQVGGRQGGGDQRRGNAGFSPSGCFLARVRGRGLASTGRVTYNSLHD